MKMEKSIQITLIIAVTLIVLALIGIYGFYQLPFIGGNTITVEGVSNIKATPDLVTIYFNAETKGSSAKEAKDKNAEMVEEVIISLMKIGFAREEIQTTGLNIYQDYVWDGQKSVAKGWKASHQIKVELTTAETSKIGEVIDAGVDNGAMLSYINFELSPAKQNEYKAQALKEAGQDAQVQADSLAEGLGKKAGRLVSVSTSNFNYMPWNIYTSSVGGMREDVAMAKEATISIQPSDQEVNARVSAVYKIV
jgi:hypothetical protein